MSQRAQVVLKQQNSNSRNGFPLWTMKYEHHTHIYRHTNNLSRVASPILKKINNSIQIHNLHHINHISRLTACVYIFVYPCQCLSHASHFQRCYEGSDRIDGRVGRASTTGDCLHVYIFVCEFIDSIGAIEG